jgi:hypothetical protein
MRLSLPPNLAQYALELLDITFVADRACKCQVLCEIFILQCRQHAPAGRDHIMTQDSETLFDVTARRLLHLQPHKHCELVGLAMELAQAESFFETEDFREPN